ncbi:catechol 2,3-dioxygenase [Burkholderia multivorans]|uniref:catechol 2,3-dioxygenase n=1 Tax=Burkholderia cepacia complex TaxID=87882 RepID=UPI00075BB7BE|nr:MULTISPECIES: catechol 2,3-dioxygenase [Burkholderia cepacia complex]KVV21671.1 catechol 2,3-dioxygenase [Burkholderia multivorans]MCA7888641.1 catechol 2,3-dioxygenase [Burkholderia contaminans]MDN7576814.1 catechol 2,3-dioxygenase [Burkholderia contaminans]PRF33403.1 catechol 2,3-dioxygenase [Burkholderia multivorans]
MSMQGVLRPGHVALRVMDLDEAVRHYCDVLGLLETGRDDAGRVYLKAWDEHDHHSVVLRESDSPGLDYMGFKVGSDAALDELSVRLRDAGAPIEWMAPGEHLSTGRRLRFVAPTGHVFELFAEKDLVGNGMPTTNPGVTAPGLKGIHPTRFDHCALYGDDVDGVVSLFVDVLGFQITEKFVDGEMLLGVFLTCSTKPHDVAFMRAPVKGKLHHVSFNVDSWSEVLRAADLIAEKNVSHDVGPTRHGATRGETLYFFDPSGNRNEVFSGGYIWYPDRPSLTWTADEIAKGLFYHERKVKESFISVMT